MMIRTIVFCWVILLLPVTLLSQSETPSSSASLYDVAFDSAVLKLNSQQLAVYNGIEYYHYYLKEESKHPGYWLAGVGNRPGEHPFYLSGEFQKQEIVYQGVRYPSILLAFDIVRSQVVVLSPKKKAIVLPLAKVNSFQYAGHSFKYLSGVNNLDNDFYDVLFSSDSVSFCAKRIKRQTELWHTLVEYYVIINNRSYSVNALSTRNIGAKNMILKILKDKKSQVRAFIRQNNLKFKKSRRELSMTRVVEYYASLK